MKLRYRIIGILLLVGIYFGYRHDPADEFVTIRNIKSEDKSGYPVKVSILEWRHSYRRSAYNRVAPDIFMGKFGSETFIPVDIESAEKIEAYLESR